MDRDARWTPHQGGSDSHDPNSRAGSALSKDLVERAHGGHQGLPAFDVSPRAALAVGAWLRSQADRYDRLRELSDDPETQNACWISADTARCLAAELEMLDPATGQTVRQKRASVKAFLQQILAGRNES